MYYQIEGASWKLTFGAQATSLMLEKSQISSKQAESVGQLYSRDLTGNVLMVERATCLKPQRASRGRVQFNPASAFAEREQLFQQGLHCVGLWHTHPEPHPSPSWEDRRLAQDYAVAAQPALSGIIFVIVGNLPTPRSLKVWVAEGAKLHPATQQLQSEPETRM